jgi:hypothetical protein
VDSFHAYGCTAAESLTAGRLVGRLHILSPGKQISSTSRSTSDKQENVD